MKNKIKPELVQTKEQLDNFITHLRGESAFSFDTETNAKFDLYEVELVGISLATRTRACYIPVGHFEGEQLLTSQVIATISDIFNDSKKRAIAHNAVFDQMVLSRYGLEFNCIVEDTYVMAWLCDESRGNKGLKVLVKKHFGYDMTTYDEVVAQTTKGGVKRDYNFARADIDLALSYASDDAIWTFKLYNMFWRKLEEENLLQVYEKIERPLLQVLLDMKLQGVAIDTEYLDFADERFPNLIEELEAKIFKEAGEVFNLNATRKLGEILFDKLEIGRNVKRTKNGNYATDKKTLALYQGKHDIVDNILKRKQLVKNHSVFIKGLKEQVSKDGRVHPSFNSCGTVTGRFSCKDPNLQQIQGDEIEEVKIRNFFIPSEGNKFVVADYSQIELRIMAHFSKDEAMIHALTSGGDIHDAVARDIFGLTADDEVTRRQRLVAKTLNFGVGYGRGPVSIAEQLDISQGEAANFIEEWFASYPRVKGYKDWLINQARNRGYIRTISGRKRRLPEIRSADWRERGGAERQAFNTKIQGSAADIIKAAMLSLDKSLKPYKANIIIQIHDELVVDSPAENTDKVVETMQSVMENPLNGKNPLRLPLVAEPVIADKWGDAK